MADRKEYLQEEVYRSSDKRARQTFLPFLKEMVRYTRNEGSGDTIGQVGGYADGLEAVAPAIWDAAAVANSTVFKKMADTLGYSGDYPAFLVYLRTHRVQDIITRLDIAMTADEVDMLMTNLQEVERWGDDLPWADPVGKSPWSKLPDNRNDSRETTYTVDGRSVTIRETCDYDNGGARIKEVI